MNTILAYISILVVTFIQIQLSGAQQSFHPNEYPQKSESQVRPPHKFTALPGNVIVHFDSSHDIQRLQYVLQDGRLATLYQRRPYPSPSGGRAPIQVPADEGPQIIRREETATPTKSASSETPMKIDHDQTINILDSKLRKVSQLVGDHVTIELPNHKIFEGQLVSVDAHKLPAHADKELDVIATVAVDALQAGESKLRKAGTIVLEKLKSKVSEKLRDLPSLIEMKLREKSSIGQVFMDNAGRKVMLVEADDAPATSQQHQRQQRHHHQQQQLSQQVFRPATASSLYLDHELSRQELRE